MSLSTLTYNSFHIFNFKYILHRQLILIYYFLLYQQHCLRVQQICFASIAHNLMQIRKYTKYFNCDKEYKTNGNTTNLKNHLKRFHPSDKENKGEV